MTPAEAARRSRRAQGLPDTIRDPGVLDQLAAFIAATSAGPQSGEKRAQAKAGGRRGSAAA